MLFLHRGFGTEEEGFLGAKAATSPSRDGTGTADATTTTPPPLAAAGDPADLPALMMGSNTHLSKESAFLLRIQLLYA